ncbi:hypothetical protein BGX27_002889, partial [Mortierella sp. AM989]
MPVGRHPQDKYLCHVEAYLEYTSRIVDTPLKVGHHKDPNHTFNPSMRFTKDKTKVARVSTISVYMVGITRLIKDFPLKKPSPKPQNHGLLDR